MDISQGCFSGPITQFDALRLVWSEVAGYGIRDLTAQGGPLMPSLDFDVFSDQDLLGEWPEGAPDDPLLILLVHHEGQGRIKWQHCPFLADRLENLEMVLISQTARPVWLLLTQQFIRGLRTAAHYRTDVVFS